MRVFDSDMNPLVSVIMPVYNAEAFLKAAIDSILYQSYTRFELIIINDGSTDNCQSVITSYNDDRIVYLSNPVNRGLVYSLNRGIENSKGNLIARMDADDIAFLDRLKIQVAFFAENPQYGMCGTFYQVIDIHGKKKQRVNLPQSDTDIRSYLNFGNCFCHSTVMFRTELASQARYDEQFSLVEDYKLWLDFAKISLFTILPIYTVFYRFHNSNISATKKEQTRKQLKKMNAMMLNDLKLEPTERELNIHSNFLVFNGMFFKTPEDIRDLETWLLKLYTILKHSNKFNSRVIARMFLRRWFVICVDSRNYINVFSFPFLLEFKWNYLKTLFAKIRDSLFHKNLGIDY